ncbi:MAG: serine hydrolase [Gemmatimonadaceae bacterium]|nr:serine hydrolase [Gemmatimonadaceae bacterium]
MTIRNRAASASRVLVVATLVGAIVVTPGHAQDTTAIVRLADRVFASRENIHGPGCAVGIAQGGRTLLERAYGMADLNAARALTPATILESGSVAKQFTAAAVLLLMQDGRLSLEDDVRTYVPELPAYARTITIRHLLTHTSGLREWSNLMEWQGWPRGTRLHTHTDVIDAITRQRSLNYPVGDHYSYTNSGFLLLRTVVERVSGMPFTRFTATRIFTPLGMRHTRWRDDFTEVVPGLAQAYSLRDGAWHLDMPFDNVIGAGGLLSTVGDWLTWNAALDAKALGPAVGDSLTRQMRLTGGTTIQYALGVVVSSYRGTREIAHSGSTAGYSTYLARYPDLDHLSVAVMCNGAGLGATGYAHALVDGLAPSLARAPAPDSIAGDAAALSGWAGLYRDTRTNMVVVVDTAGGRLRIDGAALTPLRDGAFARGGTRLRLAAGRDGAAPTIRVRTADGDTVVHVRMAARAWTPAPQELAALEGRYRSDEIGATHTVRVVNGALTVSPRVGVSTTLTPAWRDAFSAPGGSVWFARDARGRVTAMHFGSSRAWDFVLTRQP